jgi:hypothetical protein
MKKDMMSDVKDKLKAELADAKKKGRYAAAVMDSCVKALLVFAEQDEEFAAAILDGSLGKCGEAIEKGCQGKKAVSDLDVYRMAVQHFFPGAEVEFSMTVRVNPHEGVGEVVREVPPVTVNKRINLLDLI